MVAIQREYRGDLHCKAVHGPSGNKLTTDAPTDNQGRGESFSLTDLVATALGSCMLTVMGIQARALKIDVRGRHDNRGKGDDSDAAAKDPAANRQDPCAR